MITLILAEPRTGKSQYAVSLGVKAKEAGKRVFVTNFHQTAEQREKSGFELYADDGVWPADGPREYTGDPSKWLDELPSGAVWIVDEVQQVIPQRGKDREVPLWIKQLSVHGHKDLTIYLLTQDGMQMDVTARRNCNFTHILSRPLGMSRCNIYEYRRFQTLPDDAWRRSQTLKSAESKKTFKYSKRWQELYISASAHEHIKRRFPVRLLMLPLAVIFVGACFYFAWSRLKPGEDDTANPAVAAVAGALTGAQAPSAAGAGAVLTFEQWRALREPRVAGVPDSAPMFDGREVKDYPRPVCYMSSRFRTCRCVTQQGSRLEMKQAQCLAYVANGYFDPYRDPDQDIRSVDRNDSGGDDDGDGEFETPKVMAQSAAPVGGGLAEQVTPYGGIGYGPDTTPP